MDSFVGFLVRLHLKVSLDVSRVLPIQKQASSLLPLESCHPATTFHLSARRNSQVLSLHSSVPHSGNHYPCRTTTLHSYYRVPSPSPPHAYALLIAVATVVKSPFRCITYRVSVIVRVYSVRLEVLKYRALISIVPLDIVLKARK